MDMKPTQVLITGLLYLATHGTAMAQGNPAIGKAKTLICTGCHARDGNSSNPIYPALAGQGQAYLAKQLRDFKTGARKEEHMTPIVEALTADEIPDIAAYFAAQARKPGTASTPGSEPGKQLFQQGDEARDIVACTGCHGADGKGNTALKIPSLTGQHADYVAKTLKEFRSAARSNDLQGAMRSIAVGLSDQDITALATHIASMR